MYIPKLLPWENAARRVAFWRARGKRPAAVAGTFDLLHGGHIDLLKHAWSAGDRTIVCLRSDESAERLKGPGRPVVEFRERAAILAALSTVDLIVPFPLPGCADETPAGLLELLRPHALVTGARPGVRLPGEEFCGWVDYVPRSWDISTSVRIATIESAGLLKFAAKHRNAPAAAKRQGITIAPPRWLPP